VARALHKEEPVTNKFLMKTNQINNEIQQSTYALLVRSEEKVRGLFETIAYGLFILSAVAAIGQFVLQTVNLPLSTLPQTASVTQVERPAGS
jgi:hypothetical protein